MPVYSDLHTLIHISVKFRIKMFSYISVIDTERDEYNS